MAVKSIGTIYVDENSNFHVSIPAKVFHDSTFPFKKGEKVEVEIVGEGLQVAKLFEGSSSEADEKSTR